jgi:surface antigen
MKAILQVILSVCLLGVAWYASSSNMGFLYDSPTRHFTAEDWKLIDSSTATVLNTYPLHKKALWKNPQSQHEGYIVALNKTHMNNMECKDIKFFTVTAYGNSNYKFTFCKYPSVGWKINAGH